MSTVQLARIGILTSELARKEHIRILACNNPQFLGINIFESTQNAILAVLALTNGLAKMCISKSIDLIVPGF